MVSAYSVERSPVEGENREATAAKVAATTALNDAKARVSALEEKVEFDQGNLDAWSQFVVDEGVRCQNEESSYNNRMDER